MSDTHRSVLPVEDDPGDVVLVREVLARHPAGSCPQVVGDGVQAAPCR